MDIFRKLFPDEIESLKSQHCKASDWDMIEVVESFRTDYVWHTRFSGHIRLGKFEGEFEMPGGMRKHAGLYHVTLHQVRGARFESDPFVISVKEHIKEKTELYDEVMLKLSGISSTVRKKRTQKQ